MFIHIYVLFPTAPDLDVSGRAYMYIYMYVFIYIYVHRYIDVSGGDYSDKDENIDDAYSDIYVYTCI
jgi:hypothetical protein